MNKPLIHIEGVGYRNPIDDFEEIAWLFSQVAKGSNPSHATRYWLNLHEKYFDTLMKVQAFELIAFLKSQTTEKQKKNREIWKDRHKKMSKATMEEHQQMMCKAKYRFDIIQNISLN